MHAEIETANLLLNLTVGDWVDIACLGVLIIHAIVGYLLRFTRMLASLTGMLLALQGGYWLFPTIDYHLRRIPFAVQHPTLGTLATYLIAVTLGLLLYFLLRLLLHRFFRLLVEQPFDRIFGMLTGLVMGVTLLFFIFTVASLLPEKHNIRQAFCTQSRTGGIITPAVCAILDKRPNAVLRIKPAGWRLPKLKKDEPKPSKPAAASPRSKQDKR